MKEEQAMPKWIRLDNDRVVETTDTDPKGRFHPDLKWIKAATSVEEGMVKQADGSYAFPEPAPENAIAATPTPSTPLTKLAFMNRFTMEELAAIYTAAKTEVMVEVFMDKLKLAEYVDVTDPQTVAGLQSLAAAGLLSEARVQEILR
ncbi:hypothetical protein [Yanghanlia caeni]|uniref:Uncharacterized protein n=1 Tax=Yanghanlia caeni TaxID=3064283 RepID=A0ABU1D5C2_9BURK|nr:hypothetical protein [Alcaligenaceae bacterium LG-2]